jgi:hypothetical protein
VQARAGGNAADVALERIDGRVKVVVALDVRQGQVVLKGCGPHRCAPGARLLHWLGFGLLHHMRVLRPSQHA